MDKPSSIRVLTVDDDDGVRGVITTFLEDNDFTVFQAENGRKGLDIIRNEGPDLVLLDLCMPEMNGFEVLSAATRESPDIPMIVISGQRMIEDAIKALKLGAWDYVTKPILDTAVLRHAVSRALERARLLRENRRYKEHLEEEVQKRTVELEERSSQLEKATTSLQKEIEERIRSDEELQKSMINLRKALEGTIRVVASTVEVRDPYTAGHQRRVAHLARDIASEMGLSGEIIDGVYMAGVVHDLGKICVPAEILSKPTELNTIEFNLIKTHPQVGFDLLKTIDFPWPIARIVLQHHEKINGSGYPNGLAGDEILLEARILTVADVVEAMASHRPYRPSRGTDKALDEISRNSGRFYDPEVADVCLKLFLEKGYVFT